MRSPCMASKNASRARISERGGASGRWNLIPVDRRYKLSRAIFTARFPQREKIDSAGLFLLSASRHRVDRRVVLFLYPKYHTSPPIAGGGKYSNLVPPRICAGNPRQAPTKGHREMPIFGAFEVKPMASPSQISNG